MASTLTSRKPGELRREDHLFSLPVRRLIPKEWQTAAHKASYHAAAFAEILGLSERQLLRQCQRRLNCSTKALLTHLQMLAALELLQETDCFKEVGAQLGFKDPSSFGHRFKAYFGVTPWEFVNRKYYHLLRNPAKPIR